MDSPPLAPWRPGATAAPAPPRGSLQLCFRARKPLAITRDRREEKKKTLGFLTCPTCVPPVSHLCPTCVPPVSHLCPTCVPPVSHLCRPLLLFFFVASEVEQLAQSVEERQEGVQLRAHDAEALGQLLQPLPFRAESEPTLAALLHEQVLNVNWRILALCFHGQLQFKETIHSTGIVWC